MNFKIFKPCTKSITQNLMPKHSVKCYVKDMLIYSTFFVAFNSSDVTVLQHLRDVRLMPVG